MCQACPTALLHTIHIPIEGRSAAGRARKTHALARIDVLDRSTDAGGDRTMDVNVFREGKCVAEHAVIGGGQGDLVPTFLNKAVGGIGGVGKGVAVDEPLVPGGVSGGIGEE